MRKINDVMKAHSVTYAMLEKRINDYENEINGTKDKQYISVQSLKNTACKGNPTASTIEKIAKAIGCSPAEFFEEPQAPAPSIVCPHCHKELNVTVS